MKTNRSALSAQNSETNKPASFLNSTMMTVNKKCLSASLSTLGLMTLCLGSLVATVQPALASYEWVRGSNGFVPPGAVLGGTDTNDPLYVCRADRKSGKLNSRFKKCYTSYGGKEQEHANYDVLVSNDMQWVALSSSVPPNAIVGGYDDNDVALYVCRGSLKMGQRTQFTPGKYNEIHKKCYTPYGGKEYEHRSAQILVEKLVYAPSISGALTVSRPSKGLRCQDIEVYLKVPDRYVHAKYFTHSSRLRGDIKVKCNYSIAAYTFDAGKTASISFSAGPNYRLSEGRTTVDIPRSQPLTGEDYYLDEFIWQKPPVMGTLRFAHPTPI